MMEGIFAPFHGPKAIPIDKLNLEENAACKRVIQRTARLLRLCVKGHSVNATEMSIFFPRMLEIVRAHGLGGEGGW